MNPCPRRQESYLAVLVHSRECDLQGADVRCRNDWGEFGAHIQDVIIIFCSLQPQAELSKGFSARAFHLLHDIICKFDDALERFGMIKYQ